MKPLFALILVALSAASFLVNADQTGPGPVPAGVPDPGPGYLTGPPAGAYPFLPQYLDGGRYDVPELPEMPARSFDVRFNFYCASDDCLAPVLPFGPQLNPNPIPAPRALIQAPCQIVRSRIEQGAYDLLWNGGGWLYHGAYPNAHSMARYYLKQGVCLPPQQLRGTYQDSQYSGQRAY